MVTKALLVRLDAKDGKDAEVEDFLTSARPIVEGESATTAWFAVRFGRGEYGIFDVFGDEAGRDAHLSGEVAQALSARGDELFASPPQIQKADVLAAKLPSGASRVVTKGLLLLLPPKAGHESEVEEFLRGGEAIVAQEQHTIAWFALRLEDGRFGIFDVFPDSGGRFAHLTGKVPRELAKHALSLLGGFPDLTLLDVKVSKLPR
jgi:quinol monooxygenase YgiN